MEHVAAMTMAMHARLAKVGAVPYKLSHSFDFSRVIFARAKIKKKGEKERGSLGTSSRQPSLRKFLNNAHQGSKHCKCMASRGGTKLLFHATFAHTNHVNVGVSPYSCEPLTIPLFF